MHTIMNKCYLSVINYNSNRFLGGWGAGQGSGEKVIRRAERTCLSGARMRLSYIT